MIDLIDRRSFVVGVGGGLLAVPLLAEAESPATAPKVGYLSPGSLSNDPLRLDAFREALREQGYVDGRTIVVIPRFANEDYRRLSGLAAELARLKVDVIVAVTSPAARAAQQATKSIPIVFTYVADAVRTGLVVTLARPGANLTGYSDITAELVQKRLALLKDVAPGVKRIGILENPANPGGEIVRGDLDSSARQLGLELFPSNVEKATDLEAAFGILARQGVGAMIVAADLVLSAHRYKIAGLAMSHRLPMIGWSKSWAEAGALLSYGTATNDKPREVAAYVVKILQGTRPAELPVVQASEFQLVINLKTAKALGLTIPPSLLARADQVIE